MTIYTLMIPVLLAEMVCDKRLQIVQHRGPYYPQSNLWCLKTKVLRVSKKAALHPFLSTISTKVGFSFTASEKVPQCVFRQFWCFHMQILSMINYFIDVDVSEGMCVMYVYMLTHVRGSCIGQEAMLNVLNCSQQHFLRQHLCGYVAYLVARLKTQRT